MMAETHLGRFARFAVVGGTATATHYLVLVTLVSWSDVRPLTASLVGYVLSALLNYQLNHSFTFRSQRSHAFALPRFLCIALLGLILNGLLVWLTNEVLGAHYLVAQITATAVVLLWNYHANRRWTF
jgi:putative flippase GtrA